MSRVHYIYCVSVCVCVRALGTASAFFVHHMKTVKLDPSRKHMLLLLETFSLIAFSQRLLRKHESLIFRTALKPESCQGPLTYWRDAIMISDHTRIALPRWNMRATLCCSQLSDVLLSIDRMCPVRSNSARGSQPGGGWVICEFRHK